MLAADHIQNLGKAMFDFIEAWQELKNAEEAYVSSVLDSDANVYFYQTDENGDLIVDSGTGEYVPRADCFSTKDNYTTARASIATIATLLDTQGHGGNFHKAKCR